MAAAAAGAAPRAPSPEKPRSFATGPRSGRMSRGSSDVLDGVAWGAGAMWRSAGETSNAVAVVNHGLAAGAAAGAETTVNGTRATTRAPQSAPRAVVCRLTETPLFLWALAHGL